MKTPKKLLQPKEVESEYGISEALQYILRRGRKLSYHKISPGRSGGVYYQRQDIEEWLDRTRVERAQS
ncbi:MAG TPA: DNA-binding protein [Thermoanaerobaculia bacterium]|jgi:hypothetical protein|nr:DNA-binding protein [Thermoanaerobaculia bacterium]